MSAVEKDAAPEQPVDVDKTERHLLRARQLLRDARERLFRSEAKDPAEAPPDEGKREL